MSRYVDKMNLPQYKYFNNMIGRDEEIHELVSDTLTGELLLKCGDKKSRSEGFLLLSKARQRIAGFLYCQEEDQRRCRKELATKDIKQLQKTLDGYMDTLLVLPYFQGKSKEKEHFLSEEAQSALTAGQLERRYKRDKENGKYYTPYTSVPKLLLVNENLYEEYSQRGYTDKAQTELDRLVSEDVHYIITVQSSSQAELAYMVGKKDEAGLYIQVLDREKGTRKIPLEKLLSEQNEMTAVLLCLQDYLQEMELAEKQRRKYSEEHPDRSTHGKKLDMYERFVDKNAIKVFDIKDKDDISGFMGGLLYLSRKGGGSASRAVGYEMVPHTRKGHYRTYKSGKTVYVKASVIHKEKYQGIQSAHRINQADDRDLSDLDQPAGNTFTQGMSM